MFVTGGDGFIGSHVKGIRVSGDIREVRSIPDGIVIHLAALKDVQRSYAHPLEYWDVNVGGTINLLKSMKGGGIVFASSAAVYDNSPYGHTKAACEQLIKDSGKRYAILRIHNPVGPGCSGLFAALKTGRVRINGDGSTVRDYCHVKDVARAIQAAADELDKRKQSFICDVGSGVGTTTLQAAKMLGAKIDFGPAVEELSVSVAKDIRYPCRPLPQILGEL